MTLEQILEEHPDETFLKADGFDDCVIGICESFFGRVLIYSKRKVIEKLTHDMTQEEAEEHYVYNILGSYMGELTPVYLDDTAE